MPDTTDAPLPKDRKAAFEAMHHEKMLGAHETTSGAGSSLLATYDLRRSIEALIEMRIVTGILDIGCGDFNWMSEVDLKETNYLGIDIVGELIDDNARRWGNANRRFQAMDIVEEVPLRMEFALCKDVFTHLSHADTAAAFNNVKKSGARYIAMTNYSQEMTRPSQADYYHKHMNTDASSGYWRPTDLLRKPFYLRAPLWRIGGSQGGKSLDIWALDDLPFMDPAQIAHPMEHNPVNAEDFERYRFYRMLKELPFIEKIGLFGSRAKRTNRPDSDLDIMLFCTPETTRQQWLDVCEIIRLADIPLGIDCMRYGDSLQSTLDYFLPSDCRILYERP